jgi:hypothetical protein
MRRFCTLILATAATLWLVQAAFAQDPSEAELNEFADIFIALQENARPLQARGADADPDAWRDRRASVDIVEEHGWTLERYNAVAYQVNSTEGVWQRFRTLMEQRSCAGLLRSPPQDCD